MRLGSSEKEERKEERTKKDASKLKWTRLPYPWLLHFISWHSYPTQNQTVKNTIKHWFLNESERNTRSITAGKLIEKAKTELLQSTYINDGSKSWNMLQNEVTKSTWRKMKAFKAFVKTLPYHIYLVYIFSFIKVAMLKRNKFLFIHSFILQGSWKTFSGDFQDQLKWLNFLWELKKILLAKIYGLVIRFLICYWDMWVLDLPVVKKHLLTKKCYLKKS